jgi:hypothetical protein
MTREEILAMGAGRELDVAVAERVACCRVRRHRHHRCFLYDLVIPGGVDSIDWTSEAGAWSGTPNYSTSIADAWQVVELLKGMGRLVVITADALMRGNFNPHYTVHFGSFGDAANANTAPEAICKAALLAIKE